MWQGQPQQQQHYYPQGKFRHVMSLFRFSRLIRAWQALLCFVLFSLEHVWIPATEYQLSLRWLCKLNFDRFSRSFVLDPNQQQFYGQSPYPPQNGFQQPAPYNPAYPHQMPSQQPPYMDPEDPEAKGFDFSDESIRKGFIRKVYSILTCQLSITLAIISLFVFHEPTKLWVARHRELFWIALIVLIVTMIALACCESVRRKSPMNFIFLALFTLAQSFLLGCTSAIYQPDTVLMAVGVTTAVCLGLTIFAFQTKWDFTVCGGELKQLLRSSEEFNFCFHLQEFCSLPLSSCWCSASLRCFSLTELLNWFTLHLAPCCSPFIWSTILS